MNNIDEIMDMLDWGNREETQKKGRELAEDIKSVNVFLQPLNQNHSKNVWDNCAKVLASRSDEELQPYVDRLIEWLSDMNWPGAWTILERFKSYKDVVGISKVLNYKVQKANKYGTAEELCFLDHVSKMLDIEGLAAVLPRDTFEILGKHYMNRGWWDEKPKPLSISDTSMGYTNKSAQTQPNYSLINKFAGADNDTKALYMGLITQSNYERLKQALKDAANKSLSDKKRIEAAQIIAAVRQQFNPDYENVFEHTR